MTDGTTIVRTNTATPKAASAAAAAPLSDRAAIAILGSMLFLILALTVVLVQTTWVATQLPTTDVPAYTAAAGAARDYAQR